MTKDWWTPRAYSDAGPSRLRATAGSAFIVAFGQLLTHHATMLFMPPMSSAAPAPAMTGEMPEMPGMAGMAGMSSAMQHAHHATDHRDMATHAHAMLTLPMLAAHAAALLTVMVAMGATESGYRRIVAALCRLIPRRLPNLGPRPPRAFATPAYEPRVVLRLLASSGLGTRGPPAYI